LKRAKLLIVLSVFVLSSFALQNPAGSAQNPSLGSKPGGSKPGQSSPTPAASAQGVSSQSPASQVSPTQGIPSQGIPQQIFGFRDFAKQYQVDQEFLASPSPARAEQHLKILTALPHIAGSPEDKGYRGPRGETLRHCRHGDRGGQVFGMDEPSVGDQRDRNGAAEREDEWSQAGTCGRRSAGRQSESSDAVQRVVTFCDVEAEVVYAN